MHKRPDKKVFNQLRGKTAQADPLADLGAGMAADPMMGDPMAADPMMGEGDLMTDDAAIDPEGSQAGPFTLSSLIEWIDADPVSAMHELRNKVPNQQVTSDDGNHFEAWTLLEPDEWGRADSSSKGKVAGLIMEMLPPEDKVSEESTIPVEKQKVDIEATVKASNEAIRKLAQEHVANVRKSANSKTYNGLKTAQSRAQQHALVFGPDSAKLLPSVQQVGNDWHIIERNKGWGKKLEEFYGIDYEMFWRQNIMDKYSRPYRDKAGNWVGGYLEKRFETDRNIPEENNIQLKPGEYRKPRPLQFGLLEARMNHAEESNGSRSFNLARAKSDRSIKTASSNQKKK